MGRSYFVSSSAGCATHFARSAGMYLAIILPCAQKWLLDRLAASVFGHETHCIPIKVARAPLSDEPVTRSQHRGPSRPKNPRHREVDPGGIRLRAAPAPDLRSGPREAAPSMAGVRIITDVTAENGCLIVESGMERQRPAADLRLNVDPDDPHRPTTLAVVGVNAVLGHPGRPRGARSGVWLRIRPPDQSMLGRQ